MQGGDVVGFFSSFFCASPTEGPLLPLEPKPMMSATPPCTFEPTPKTTKLRPKTSARARKTHFARRRRRWKKSPSVPTYALS